MKIFACLLAAALLGVLAGQALALTSEEVIRLKKAGVSDAVIEKMMEQERAGGLQGGPMEDTGDEVVYRAGRNNAARTQRNSRHERWKEEKSMEAVGNIIIDGRRSR